MKYILKIGDRYFYKYQNNRLLTAWSIAGAKEIDSEEEVKKIEKIISEKGKHSIRIHIV